MVRAGLDRVLIAVALAGALAAAGALSAVAMLAREDRAVLIAVEGSALEPAAPGAAGADPALARAREAGAGAVTVSQRTLDGLAAAGLVEWAWGWELIAAARLEGMPASGLDPRAVYVRVEDEELRRWLLGSLQARWAHGAVEEVEVDGEPRLMVRGWWEPDYGADGTTRPRPDDLLKLPLGFYLPDLQRVAAAGLLPVPVVDAPALGEPAAALPLSGVGDALAYLPGGTAVLYRASGSQASPAGLQALAEALAERGLHLALPAGVPADLAAAVLGVRPAPPVKALSVEAGARPGEVLRAVRFRQIRLLVVERGWEDADGLRALASALKDGGFSNRSPAPVSTRLPPLLLGILVLAAAAGGAAALLPVIRRASAGRSWSVLAAHAWSGMVAVAATACGWVVHRDPGTSLLLRECWAVAGGASLASLAARTAATAWRRPYREAVGELLAAAGMALGGGMLARALFDHPLYLLEARHLPAEWLLAATLVIVLAGARSPGPDGAGPAAVEPGPATVAGLAAAVAAAVIAVPHLPLPVAVLGGTSVAVAAGAAAVLVGRASARRRGAEPPAAVAEARSLHG